MSSRQIQASQITNGTVARLYRKLVASAKKQDFLWLGGTYQSGVLTACYAHVARDFDPFAALDGAPLFEYMEGAESENDSAEYWNYGLLGRVLIQACVHMGTYCDEESDAEASVTLRPLKDRAEGLRLIEKEKCAYIARTLGRLSNCTGVSVTDALSVIGAWACKRAAYEQTPPSLGALDNAQCSLQPSLQILRELLTEREERALDWRVLSVNFGGTDKEMSASRAPFLVLQAQGNEQVTVKLDAETKLPCMDALTDRQVSLLCKGASTLTPTAALRKELRAAMPSGRFLTQMLAVASGACAQGVDFRAMTALPWA